MVHVSETFSETGETVSARRAEKREQCSPHSLSARHGCNATWDSKSDSDFGIRPPDPAQFEERGRENHGDQVSWLVRGSFQGVLTCWDFRTPCVRAVLDGRFLHSVHHGRCASITHSVRVACACYFRTRTGCIWAMGLRRSIPAVRSHGRINVTGSGI